MTQPASKRLVSEARFTDISTAAANSALAGAQSQIDASAASAAASANSAAQSAASATAPASTAVDTRLGSGVGLSVAATTAAADIQTALDNATTNGQRAVAFGTITTSSTLTIRGDCDLSQLTINYTGTGVAVRVGDLTTAQFRRAVKLPRVFAAAKTVTGWAQVAGQVGVEIRNAYNFDITIPHVKNFETGVYVYGSNALGTSYCDIHVGHLENNKVNLRIGADDATSGYCNQNTYYGGRYGHNSTEGTNVVGTRHILLDALSVNASPNNNVWVNPSIESPTVVEFCIDVQGGSYNQWMNPRMEFTSGNSKIRWGAKATRNLILGGNQVDNIVETWVTGATLNNIIGTSTMRFLTSTTTGGGAVFENTAGNTSPAVTIMRATGSQLGDSPQTAYGTRLEYNVARWKRYTEANERVRVDGNAGRIYLGDGTAAPVSNFYGVGAFLFFGTGATTVGFETDNAADLGAAANYRPRYVRVGTAVQTGRFATASRPAASTAGQGAMIYDTTLSKPVWSDGTTWRDATGTAV